MANNDYITTDCKLTVSKNTAKLDEEIFLYKNDRNIKLLIEIVDNKYRYKSDDLSNLLVKYKASYAQVKWYKNAEVKKEFPIQATDDGKVVFVIEGQLIDEDTELGDYDLQLRLLNESQESIRSLPIIKGAVHILKPLFEEGDIATVNSAVADVSMLSLDGDAIDTYNSDGTYNQTNWGNGDVISSAKLNKLEKVAKDNVDKVNKMPAKSIVEGGKIYLAKEDGTKLDSGTELPASGSGTPYDDTAIKNDINTIKTDLGTEELTTTAKDIKGAVNEVAAQYKDIAKEKFKIEILEEDPAEQDLYEGRIWICSPVTYKVTNNLTNCDSSNKDTSVLKNSSYNATITPNSNYDLGTVIVTMGGIDITSTCVSNGVITITSVTGDIVITCTAISNLKPCTAITLSANVLTFSTTDTQTLTATVTPSNTTDKIIWSSKPTGIVNIDNGVVRPIKNGSCVITATCGTKSATCNITVSGIQESQIPTGGLQLYLKGSDFTNAPQTTTLTDNSGNNNNLSTAGFTYTNTSGSDGNGNIVFDGTDDRLYNDTQSLDISKGFTIIFKGSINNLAQVNKEIVDMNMTDGRDSQQLSLIYGYVTNTIELYGNTLNLREGSQIAISDTNKHTIAYSYNGSVIKGYLDGTEVVNITRTVNISSPIIKVAIGGNVTGQSYHFSKITLNKFLFYNKGLSSSEITNILNNI